MSDINETMSDGDCDFQPSLDVSSLPQVVRNRVKALKKLQFETVKAEELYYKEIHALDLKFQKQYDDINEKRLKVVSGEYEPAGDEIDWPSDTEDEEETAKAEKDLSNEMKKVALKDYTETTKGIPKFWYHTLRNANDDALMGMIQPHDEPILENLTNLTVKLNSPDNTGFILNFYFGQNDYFTDSVLTKEYELRPCHDPETPLEYDGPEIYKCKGCKINWKEGKNVTKTTIPIKKSKKGSSKKGETKEETLDSFFNFFNPPEVPEDPAVEMSPENRTFLAVDFDVGFAIKEKIIPRAVLYFTGDIFNDEDGDFEDLSDDDEEED